MATAKKKRNDQPDLGPLDPFSTFDTDAELEAEGAQYWFGDWYLQSKTTSSTNRAYTVACAEAIRPIRQALRQGKLLPEVEEVEYMKAFSECAATGWGGDGMVWSDKFDVDVQHKDIGAMPGFKEATMGEAVEFTVERCTWLLQRLPHLWGRLRIETANIANYRREEATEVGNV